MALRPIQLARFWWTFAVPVSRRDYVRHGAGLVALKYTGDVALVALAAGRLWTPADYAHSIPFLLATRLEGAPSWLMPALALWTLPFLWAGVTLTMRRALDAGWSAWLVLGFFVPYLNYLLMLALCLAPPRAAGHAPVPRAQEHRLPSALLAIGAGVAVGLLMMVLAVSALERYGVALFFGTPFGIGALTAFLFNRRYPASARETAEVAAMTLALIAGAAFLLGSEGAICLLMALPISLVVGLMGAAFGRGIALSGRNEMGPAGLALCALPLAAALEPSGATGRTLHEVRSAVEIDAPPGVVWSEVIAFPPCPRRTSWCFGWASPIRVTPESRAPASARPATACSRPAPSSSRSPRGSPATVSRSTSPGRLLRCASSPRTRTSLHRTWTAISRPGGASSA